MTEKQNDGGLPPAVIQSVTRFQGLDGAKPSTDDHSGKTVAASEAEPLRKLWTGMRGDDGLLAPFLVRAVSERVKVIGVEAPTSGDDNEYGRAAFWFEGEPAFNAFVLRLPAAPMAAVLAVVHEKWNCRVVPGHFKNAGDAE